MRRRRLLALLPAPLLLAGAAAAAAPPSLAFFGFELLNTSLEPTRADELQRIAMLDRLFPEELARRGLFRPVDTAPVAQKLERIGSLRGCNGCELDLARELGAGHAGLGWVQKVSNLILNINMQIRAADSGVLVHAGSADIRSNTEESWRRGLLYLIEHRLAGR